MNVDPVAIDEAYPAANAYMDSENAKRAIAARTADEREAFFTEYERLLLTTAGYEASPELAWRIWSRVRATPKELSLYDDVLPALKAIKEAGLTTGVISNMGMELGAMLAQLTITDYASVWVSSGEVGANKPHPEIFNAALSKAGVSALESIHVGDSYESDVRGALGAGMHPLLLWRQRGGRPPGDTASVRTLKEVLPYLREHHQVL